MPGGHLGSRESEPRMKGHRALCALLATASLYAQDTRTAQDQTPSITNAVVNRWLAPYRPRTTSGIDFRNTGRFASLVRAGNLYLSIDDAIAMALENNLDLEYQRFNPLIANSDVLRTEGGGLPRGVLYNIRQLPAGVGGPGSPLLTTVGGTSPSSSIVSNSSDLAPIQTQDQSLSIQDTTPLSSGSRIPQYDPAIAAGLNYAHQNTIETSGFITGANPYITNTVGGNLGYTQGFSTGTTVNANYNTSRFSANGTRSDYNPYLSGGLGLTVTQPLLQGFGIGNNRRFIRIAKNDQKISDEVFKQQMLETLASVVRLYWDLVSLVEDMHVKQQAVELAQKLYEDNKAQVEVGTLAPIEVKRAQAELARSRQDLTNTSGLVAQQELILKNVLTRRGSLDPVVGSAHIIPSDHIQIPAEEPPRDTRELVALALKSRPDLAQAGLQVENSQISLQGSRNALLPELDLVGSVQSNGLSGGTNAFAPSPNPLPPFLGGYGNLLSQLFRGAYPSFTVGVQLTLPVRNRVAQADAVRDELQVRQMQVRRQQLENQVRLEVENALLILQRSRADYEAAVQTRELQEEALDSEQQRYQVGASTTYLVIQAQRDLAQARSTEVVSQGNYAKAIAAVDRATGQTLETYHITVDQAYKGVK